MNLDQILEEKNKSIFAFHDPRNRMVYDVAIAIHADDWLGAGSRYAAHVRATKDKNYRDPDTKDKVVAIAVQLLHWCLNNDRYPLAARLLWTESQFDPRPHFSEMIWDTLKNSAATMLMGSASASKSYSTGVWLLLDWIRDPEYTCVRVLGPSQQHLSENLFSHLVNLHQNASIPLPGEVGDLYIGTDRRSRFGSISGVVVPLGKKAAGRLQGVKAGSKKRKVAHPVFGITGRLRVFMDESEKIPEGIWKDVDNIFSNLNGTEIFKIIAAYNPENQNGPSGTRSEPKDGWAKFDIDKDECWISKRGWSVVRLDGFKGENVVHQKVIFPGLQTYEGIQKLIENAGGFESPGATTMARAAFPRIGAMLTIIPQGMFDNAKGTFQFKNAPTPVAGADLALEGGDAAPFFWGEYGEAVGYRLAPSLKHPAGEYFEFRNSEGDRILRPAIQVTGMLRLEAGSSTKVAKQCMEMCQKIGVHPNHFMVDRTGLGQGVYDIMVDMWSSEVRGVNYTESASESKILEEDLKTAQEEYDRAHTELWFALRKYLEFKLLLFSPSIDFGRLAEQLTGRHFAPGKFNRVESKKEYKARNGGKSPDDADGATLIVHSVRKAFNLTPSMRMTRGVGDDSQESSDDSTGYTDTVNKLTDDVS